MGKFKKMAAVYFLIMALLLGCIVYSSVMLVNEIHTVGLKNIVNEFWEGTGGKK